MTGAADAGRDGRSTDIASGGGVPAWLRRPSTTARAAAPSWSTARSTASIAIGWPAPRCGHIAYVNPRLVATTLPVTDAGEVVLIRRGIDPAIGAWAQPGGFLEVDETVHEAAVRETLEETGLLVEPGEIVGLYSRLEATVVVCVFEAPIVGGRRPRRPRRPRSRPSPRRRSRGRDRVQDDLLRARRLARPASPGPGARATAGMGAWEG